MKKDKVLEAKHILHFTAALLLYCCFPYCFTEAEAKHILHFTAAFLLYCCFTESKQMLHLNMLLEEQSHALLVRK
jgi:hypothetical protein